MFYTNRKHWTTAEENFVTENADKMTTAEIARKINRTEVAVQQYMHRKRINPYEKVVRNLVREILTKKFDPEKVDLFFESKAGKIQIIENGVAVDYSEEEATKILSEEAVTAIADVKMGDATATAWGCDLTYDYIKINADYRS